MKNWKADELKVARFFGSERNPLSGGMSKHTRSDSLSPKFFIENKRRDKHAVVSLWRKIAKLAKKENKIPIVTLTESKTSGFWIVIHSTDFKEILKDMRI